MTSEFSAIENGIPVCISSPICEWWFTGFDNTSGIIVGLETEHASYVTMDPHPMYATIMQTILEKLIVCKLVIETLTFQPESTLPELYDKIFNRSGGLFSEVTVNKHSSFIVEQISNYDEAGTDEDIKISNTQALKHLVDLNLTCKPKYSRKVVRRDSRLPANSYGLTVTTPLVQLLFSEVFSRAFERNFCVSPKRKKYQAKVSTVKYGLIKWASDIIATGVIEGKVHYSRVKIDVTTLSIGDFVSFKPQGELSIQFGQIKWMFEASDRKKLLHVSILKSGCDTILGPTCDPSVIFQVNECKDVEVSIVTKVVVKSIIRPHEVDDSCDIYYCDKYYDEKAGWFCDVNSSSFTLGSPCNGCQASVSSPPTISCADEKVLMINGVRYTAGDCILVEPCAYEDVDHLENVLRSDAKFESKIDEVMFPEQFRKRLSQNKGTFSKLSKILKVAIIKDFIRENENISVKVRKLHRPWNVFHTFEKIVEKDINELISTHEEHLIHPRLIVSHCLITPNGDNFLVKDFDLKMSSSIPGVEARNKTKLRGLDIFCGAGGFTKGFEGIVHTKWAIERDDMASQTFRLNHPSCSMLVGDANKILDLILKGETKYLNQVELPQKGDVDVILAGPPCQGFSNINRYSSSTHSMLKNSLIATTLGYVDHFRPKYVYIENVKNFFKFRQGLILKLTLSSLIKMNYQVSFAILQAGCYGVPQSRNRAFIIAALTGHQLPRLPPFTNSFPLSQIQNSLSIGGMKVQLNLPQPYAMYRPLTIYDAISDLPSVYSGVQEYLEPRTAYQRNVRRNYCGPVNEHVVKTPSLLNQARIDRIPFLPHSDWRDLPNIELQLPDGQAVRKLNYRYPDIKSGRPSVCPCSGGSNNCLAPSERQEMTLIPWCLSHTANRNLQWSGLYGRLSWNEYFSTTITIPEPISKQGRVIHPEESRVISVREAARSQGFPDNYIFCGTTSDKYRQVINAILVIVFLTISCLDW